MDRLALMIVRMLLNKFDCFIIIEGNRGLGKSTIAYHLAKKVNNHFRVLAKEAPEIMAEKFEHNSKNFYRFVPKLQAKATKGRRYILYKREDVLNFYNKWNQIAIADEMINVSFNREFWNDDQKNLIKVLNMNRDHCNLLLSCVPQFQVLDNQIKNLCKIRITVIRRGLAVIQTPNRTINMKDKWDTANNEKIERDWLKKGTGLPQYAKLNTFRGMVKFPPLNKYDLNVYEKIKFNERNVIAKDLGMNGEVVEEKDDIDKALDRLIKGGIKNSVMIEGIACALGLQPNNLKTQIRNRLQKRGMNPSISSYYYDKKAKKDDINLFSID